MDRERLFLFTRRTSVFIATCLVAIVFASLSRHVSAQQNVGQRDNRQSRASGSASTASAKPNTPSADNDYSKKIKEYTTEPYFSTELVDHLPMSDKVPSPDKVLGYIAGTPNKLTYTKDLHRYYRELAKTSPRVRVFTAPERSEEGKEQLLVAVGDEASLARLDRYKEITAKLADPRKINEQEAAALIGEGKVFYWASGSIHSPETGSPEMLMELAYRLAVEETPFIQAIRKNVIVLITPTLEVDGRDKMVDLYNYRKANPGKNAPGLIYWGKYVAHDNNRDGLGMALALTRNQMKTFLEYHPAILHDLHESVPFLYTSTGTGPYNAWLDPHYHRRMAVARVSRNRRDDQARRAGRLDPRLLRWLGAQLHVLCGQRSQLDWPLLRDIWKWWRRHDGSDGRRSIATRLVPPESPASARQMVAAQQRQHAAVSNPFGDEFCREQQGPISPEFLPQEQTLGCQGVE